MPPWVLRKNQRKITSQCPSLEVPSPSGSALGSNCTVIRFEDLGAAFKTRS
ncbi:unnamed protein product [Lepidochelys kempii]